MKIEDLKKKHPEAFALMKVFRNFARFRYRPCSESGINHSQFQVLHYLFHAGKKGDFTVKVTDIAEYLEITAPTLTPLLESLVAKKLVEKKKDPDDRRIYRVKITEDGLFLLKKAFEKGISDFQTLADHLGKKDTLELIRLIESTCVFLGKDGHQKKGFGHRCGKHGLKNDAAEGHVK